MKSDNHLISTVITWLVIISVILPWHFIVANIEVMYSVLNIVICICALMIFTRRYLLLFFTFLASGIVLFGTFFAAYQLVTGSTELTTMFTSLIVDPLAVGLWLRMKRGQLRLNRPTSEKELAVVAVALGVASFASHAQWVVAVGPKLTSLNSPVLLFGCVLLTWILGVVLSKQPIGWLLLGAALVFSFVIVGSAASTRSSNLWVLAQLWAMPSIVPLAVSSSWNQRVALRADW